MDKTYDVLIPIQSATERFEIGDTIKLSDEEAAPMLGVRAIAPKAAPAKRAAGKPADGDAGPGDGKPGASEQGKDGDLLLGTGSKS